MGWRRNVLVAGCVTALTLVPVAAPAVGSPGRNGDLVVTGDGPVRGEVLADRRLFQGIPFAAPPVGELRWQTPRAPQPSGWTSRASR